jgi:predicted metal-dependent hydrolase
MMPIMEVKVVRSPRRRRTVSARIVKDILLVHAPMTISDRKLEEIVINFKAKFERKRLNQELNRSKNLEEISARLNQKYFDNNLKINSIEYVTNQNCKFGCCNYRDARIRISDKVSVMPQWVKEYVVLHEMAHLIEPNHGKSFWDIVGRYRLAERAKGYLIAVGWGMEGE